MRIWLYGEEITEAELNRRAAQAPPLGGEVVITVNEREIARVKPAHTRKRPR